MKKVKDGSIRVYDRLSNRHRAFVEYYIISFNATQAYIKTGYSDKGAVANASRLMLVPRIKMAIEERLDETADDKEAGRVLSDIRAIAYSSISNYIEWDETGKIEVKESALVDARVVKSFKHNCDKNGNTKIEIVLHDKIKALEILARRSGLLKEDDVTNGIIIVEAEGTENW